jgi:hypothetical protein
MHSAAARLCRLFQEHRVAGEEAAADEAARKQHPLKVFLLNNGLQAMQRSSPEVTTSTAFTAVYVMARTFAVANREAPTFSDPRSR